MTTTQYTAIITFTAKDEELPNILSKVNEAIVEHSENGVQISIISPTDNQ